MGNCINGQQDYADSNTLWLPVNTDTIWPGSKYGRFDIKISFAENETIGSIITKIISFLENKHKPKRFKPFDIWKSSFIGKRLVYDNGDNEQWNEMMNESITKYDTRRIIKDGLEISMRVTYEHKISNEAITCSLMNGKQTKDPLECAIYEAMKTNYKFSQENYDHITNFNHFENEMENIEECKYNQNCHAFKRLEEGGNRLQDLCHVKLYRHPPRTRNIQLQQNIHSFVLNKRQKENIPLYSPTSNDKKRYSFNWEDGYLQALIKEVVDNGFKYDLCFECKQDDECKHDEYQILQIVALKLKHQRHLMMGAPLKKDTMLALILYTGCDCNYDLCASQRNGNYQKWKWFDHCLYRAINILSMCEMGAFAVYSGLTGVRMNKKEIQGGYFRTYVSTSWDKDIATGFMKGNGMLFKFDKTVKNKKSMHCCDVSWISKFPHEAEILFARSVAGWTDSFEFHVKDNKNDVQTVELTLSGNHHSDQRYIDKRKSMLQKRLFNNIDNKNNEIK